MDNPQFQRIVRQLWSNPAEEVYAVLDAARDPRIYPAVLGCGVAFRCLYEGNIPVELAEAAPYLVRLSRTHPFTEELLADGWGQSWGVFCTAAQDLETVRRHLRRFLRAQTEEGKTLVFRYYDPRVLRVYLPSCMDAELETFFGPLSAFCMEGESGGSLLTYARRAGSSSLTKIVIPPREREAAIHAS